MFALRCFKLPGAKSVISIQTAGLKYFPPPVKYEEMEFPERRKLRFVEKVPQYPPTMRPPKMQKRLRLLRGPELLHNTFLHKQYGIIAECGGRLKWGHFEMIRLTVNRGLDEKKMFAVWRVDPPWQPITKKGQGQRMGGGKGAIDHYVTPVKAGRVIVEVAGYCEFFEVKRFLDIVAANLPFAAKAYSYETLQKKREYEEMIERENINPFNFKFLVQNNMLGCQKWTKPLDRQWFGKYN